MSTIKKKITKMIVRFMKAYTPASPHPKRMSIFKLEIPIESKTGQIP